MASEFSILAVANNTPLPAEEQLVLGQTLDRDIGFEEFQFYTVEGADFVQINSLTGDADLAVYSNASRTTGSLICISNNVEPLDVCEINGGTAFVTVFGFSAADYEISGNTRLVVAPLVVEDSVAENPASQETDADGSEEETVVTGFSDQAGGSGGGRVSDWFVLALVTLLIVRRRKLVATVGGSGQL